MFVVHWDQIPHFNTVGSFTFEVLLHETSNIIEFRYGSLLGSSFSNGASASVGLENSDGTIGVQHSFNTSGSHLQRRMPELCPGLSRTVTETASRTMWTTAFWWSMPARRKVMVTGWAMPATTARSIRILAQDDNDSDGVGDLCDGDIDNDGVVNGNDPCPADVDDDADA